MKVEVKVGESFVVFHDVQDSDAATLALIERLATSPNQSAICQISVRESYFDEEWDQLEALKDVLWLQRADIADIQSLSDEKLEYTAKLMNPLSWRTRFSSDVLTDEFVAEKLVPVARKLIDAYDSRCWGSSQRRKVWEKLMKNLQGWEILKGAFPTISDPFKAESKADQPEKTAEDAKKTAKEPEPGAKN